MCKKPTNKSDKQDVGIIGSRTTKIVVVILSILLSTGYYYSKPKLTVCTRDPSTPTTCITKMKFVKDTVNSFPMYFVQGSWSPLKIYKMIQHIIGITKNTNKVTVPVLNARDLNLSPKDMFRKHGFAILKKQSSVVDFRSPDGQQIYKGEIREILPAILPRKTKLIEFPATSYRFERTSFQVRTASKGQVAVNNPHLDFNHNWTARVEFEQRDDFLLSDGTVPELVLGVWKPIEFHKEYPTLCDNPLAMISATTYKASRDFVPTPLTLEKPPTVSYIAGGGIRHRDEQKWYYFDSIAEDEIVVFTHYSEDGRANPHTSIYFEDCPIHDRRSIETRVTIGFM